MARSEQYPQDAIAEHYKRLSEGEKRGLAQRAKQQTRDTVPLHRRLAGEKVTAQEVMAKDIIDHVWARLMRGDTVAQPMLTHERITQSRYKGDLRRNVREGKKEEHILYRYRSEFEKALRTGRYKELDELYFGIVGPAHSALGRVTGNTWESVVVGILNFNSILHGEAVSHGLTEHETGKRQEDVLQQLLLADSQFIGTEFFSKDVALRRVSLEIRKNEATKRGVKESLRRAIVRAIMDDMTLPHSAYGRQFQEIVGRAYSLGVLVADDIKDIARDPSIQEAIRADFEKKVAFLVRTVSSKKTAEMERTIAVKLDSYLGARLISEPALRRIFREFETRYREQHHGTKITLSFKRRDKDPWPRFGVR
ncbi:hypothetical protein HY622_01915 [Candidatus Uhrbacteria bacterium]|nr:hypothetical protein [Candidatus Uhrbacteria bacterium]